MSSLEKLTKLNDICLFVDDFWGSLNYYVEKFGHHFMLAVKVPALADVDAIYQELIANGVECIQQPTTYEFGSRAAYFLDYEKNIWEVFAWKEGNGPGLLDQ